MLLPVVVPLVWQIHFFGAFLCSLKYCGDGSHNCLPVALLKWNIIPFLYLMLGDHCTKMREQSVHQSVKPGYLDEALFGKI